MKGRKFVPVAERFWNFVNKTDTCWLWTGATNSDGYGVITMCRAENDGKRRAVRTHRYAWSLVNGNIPCGLSVLHKCDNPTCVNPDHLYVGTQQQNEQDKTSRGRHRNRFTPERKQGLTAELVDKIRMDTRSNYKIAKECGVSESTIRHAKSGHTWSNIPSRPANH